ncbi:MAG: CoA transferase [Deltaproteobacteria bacterium]|nr:CoA transferase [Deltaproteobacteria bacterium]
MQVLDGIKVLDVTQFISGSRCTQILADMGAEVVRVEPPSGETFRLIVNLVPGAERDYSVLNRNKYGITLDWRKPEGLDIMCRLVSLSDIFIHNLIPGTLERYHLGYEGLKKVKEDIIYVSISGFGSTGVNPERAAFDIIAQATSGQFWYDTDDLKPPTNHWADMISGAYAAIAVLFALIHRMKTGQGQFIDISMQDVLYFNNYRAIMDKGMWPIMDQVEKTLGRELDNVLNSEDRMPFYGFFKSSDGKVAIVALTQRQWGDLAQIIGHPEMADDPRFSNVIAQIHNHEEAVRRIEKWTSVHTSKEIVEILEAKKIPCGIAYTIEEVIEDENLKQRGMFQKVRHKRYGDVDVPGIPYKFSEISGSINTPGPDLGEHNHYILNKWLGYSEEEVNKLHEKGVI